MGNHLRFLPACLCINVCHSVSFDTTQARNSNESFSVQEVPLFFFNIVILWTDLPQAYPGSLPHWLKRETSVWCICSSFPLWPVKVYVLQTCFQLLHDQFYCLKAGYLQVNYSRSCSPRCSHGAYKWCATPGVRATVRNGLCTIVIRGSGPHKIHATSIILLYFILY